MPTESKDQWRKHLLSAPSNALSPRHQRRRPYPPSTPTGHSDSTGPKPLISDIVTKAAQTAPDASSVLSVLRKLRSSTAAAPEFVFQKSGSARSGATTKGDGWLAQLIRGLPGCSVNYSQPEKASSAVERSTANAAMFDRAQVKAACLLAQAMTQRGHSMSQHGHSATSVKEALGRDVLERCRALYGDPDPSVRCPDTSVRCPDPSVRCSSFYSAPRAPHTSPSPAARPYALNKLGALLPPSAAPPSLPSSPLPALQSAPPAQAPAPPVKPIGLGVPPQPLPPVLQQSIKPTPAVLSASTTMPPAQAPGKNYIDTHGPMVAGNPGNVTGCSAAGIAHNVV